MHHRIYSATDLESNFHPVWHRQWYLLICSQSGQPYYSLDRPMRMIFKFIPCFAILGILSHVETFEQEQYFGKGDAP